MSGITAARRAAAGRGTPVSKGVLAPAPGEATPVTLARYFPEEGVDELVRHYWIPRWNLPPGSPSSQSVLEYPASNLVIEADRAGLYAVSPGRSDRALEGTGWAVGVLLQPGAAHALLGGPVRALPSTGIPLRSLALPRTEELAAAVRTAALAGDDAGCVALLDGWFSSLELPDDPQRILVRRLVDLVERDRSIVRVDQLADAGGLGIRRLQRLLGEYAGFGPKWLIQRYRLHEAAHALASGSPLTLAELAAELGYSDQAHFGRDFARIVGTSPGEYQKRTAGAAF